MKGPLIAFTPRFIVRGLCERALNLRTSLARAVGITVSSGLTIAYLFTFDVKMLLIFSGAKCFNFK